MVFSRRTAEMKAAARSSVGLSSTEASGSDCWEWRVRHRRLGARDAGRQQLRQRSHWSVLVRDRLGAAGCLRSSGAGSTVAAASSVATSIAASCSSTCRDASSSHERRLVAVEAVRSASAG